VKEIEIADKKSETQAYTLIESVATTESFIFISMSGIL
jgi:hypothetical protein